jgi:hypothetical protein
MYLNLLRPIPVVQSKVQTETTNFSRLVSNMYNTNIIHYHKHNLEKQKVLENTTYMVQEDVCTKETGRNRGLELIT